MVPRQRTVERVCRYGEMSSPVRSTHSAWMRRPRSKSASEYRPPTHRRARWPDWFDQFGFERIVSPLYAARVSVSPRVTLFSLPKPMKPGFAVRLARFRSNPSAEAAASMARGSGVFRRGPAALHAWQELQRNAWRSWVRQSPRPNVSASGSATRRRGRASSKAPRL